MDSWGQLGNSFWDWNSLNPYLKKFHTLTMPSPAVCEHLGINYTDDTVRGTSGPVQACFPGVLEDPLPKIWAETFKTLKYHYAENPFSGDAIGGFNNPISADPITKTRSYAATAYYAPAKGRSNLHVITEAFVEKIIIDKPDLTARGVQYVHEGKTQVVRVKREVILAAGALQSPKILELSGIGSADLLRSHGIPVYVDNPFVGENLQDHLMTGVSFEVIDGVETIDGIIRGEPEALRAAREAYINHQKGPLASSGGTAFSFMPNVLSLGDEETRRKLWTDHIHNENENDNANAHPSHPSQSAQHALLRSLLDNPLASSAIFFMYAGQTTLGTRAVLPGNFLTICISLTHPFSRGHVHIRSPLPTDPPTIDPRYLSHPLDVAIFARQLAFVETFVATQPLASILKPDGKRNSLDAFFSDSATHNHNHNNKNDVDVDVNSALRAAEAYLRAKVDSNWHPTSTCAMLPRAMGGVVDERLRVHGVKGLRVVDASVFPMVPGGNCQTSVYAVAERGAEMIRVDCGLLL